MNSHNLITGRLIQLVCTYSALVLLWSCTTRNSDEQKNSLAVSYFFSSTNGSDTNSGASKDSPFKTLSKLNNIDLKPGDKVFLDVNGEFNETLNLVGISGTSKNKIIFSSYGFNNNENNRATINVKDALNSVFIEDCSHIELNNLILLANPGERIVNPEVKEMRCGLLVKPRKDGITGDLNFNNIVIKDVFYEKYGFQRPSKEVKTPNGTQNYGWGLRVINSNPKATIKGITIEDCYIENVGHTGIKFTGKNRNIDDIKVKNCEVIRTGGPGIQMSGVNNGHIVQNYVNNSGSNDDSRKWGRGSGLWTWGSSNILIEKNHFLNANGPADSAGAHIDFNCENIVLQYNFSANNAGGFCEILGSNYNCAYRYNISVNDGYRVKGENDAFQEGKTLWLSGFSGKGNPRKGPFNSYIYNNTIYTSKDIISKYAFDKAAQGALIMNNIFYIEGKTKLVLGDQYKPDTEGEFAMTNVVFKNNLFLNEACWNPDIPIDDESPLYDDPIFVNKGGLNIEDYLPTNTDLIKDRALPIPLIPNDSLGLRIGLKVNHDILGNPIIGTPDIGAIEQQ